MIIRDILNTKPAQLYSITPDQSVQKAVSVMVSHDIGSLLVTDGQQMVGLVTLRELLRALHQFGTDLGGKPVREIMVKNPVVGHPEDTVDYVRGVMTQHHVTHLPVLDEQEKLAGIISFHDVAKACLTDASFENVLLKRYIKNWPE
jgi:CBS domain-containing protein